jgi:hypothetical protein
MSLLKDIAKNKPKSEPEKVLMPKESFNDEDFYVFDKDKKFITSHGKRSETGRNYEQSRVVGKPTKDGDHFVLKGWDAKTHGLWKHKIKESVPQGQEVADANQKYIKDVQVDPKAPSKNDSFHTSGQWDALQKVVQMKFNVPCFSKMSIYNAGDLVKFQIADKFASERYGHARFWSLTPAQMKEIVDSVPGILSTNIQPNNDSVTANNPKSVKESKEVFTDIDNWKDAVKNSYPTYAKKMKFLSKMEGNKMTVSAEVPGLDRSFGVWNQEDEKGVVLSESPEDRNVQILIKAAFRKLDLTKLSREEQIQKIIMFVRAADEDGAYNKISRSELKSIIEKTVSLKEDEESPPSAGDPDPTGTNDDQDTEPTIPPVNPNPTPAQPTEPTVIKQAQGYKVMALPDEQISIVDDKGETKLQLPLVIWNQLIR